MTLRKAADMPKLLAKALINHMGLKICVTVSNKIQDSADRLFLNIGYVITIIKMNSDHLSC